LWSQNFKTIRFNLKGAEKCFDNYDIDALYKTAMKVIVDLTKCVDVEKILQLVNRM
jgi:hypothetical protein